MSDLFDDADVPSEVRQDVIVDDGIFIAVPAWVYVHYGKQLGPLGLAVYVALKSHANRKQGHMTFIAVKRITEELDMGESTVRREIAKLHKLRLINRRYRVGSSTEYRIFLTPPSQRTPLLPERTPLLPQANITIGTNQRNLTTSPQSLTSEGKKKHVLFKAEIQKLYEERWKLKPAWDGSEAKQLDNLLKSSPDLGVETFRSWLSNYFHSKDVTPERPRAFLPKIHKYAAGCLNQYGRIEEESATTTNGSRWTCKKCGKDWTPDHAC